MERTLYYQAISESVACDDGMTYYAMDAYAQENKVYYSRQPLTLNRQGLTQYLDYPPAGASDNDQPFKVVIRDSTFLGSSLWQARIIDHEGFHVSLGGWSFGTEGHEYLKEMVDVCIGTL